MNKELINSNKLLSSEWKTTFKEHEQRRKRNKWSEEHEALESKEKTETDSRKRAAE